MAHSPACMHEPFFPVHEVLVIQKRMGWGGGRVMGVYGHNPQAPLLYPSLKLSNYHENKENDIIS